MPARIPDISTLIQAGIDPRTRLPIKATGACKDLLKEGIKKALRIIDEQDACNRYTWYNLPLDITSQELERMLYYKGQLAFFYLKDLDKFIVAPYALDGTIDFYGRFNKIKPVPFSNGQDEKSSKTIGDYFSQLKLNVVYGLKDEEELTYDDLTDSAVLLHDYTKQLSQTIIPRVTLNDSILDVMSECVPLMRTRLMLGAGVKGIRVNDADQQDSVEVAGKRLEKAALEGTPYIPIVGNIEFQELTDNAAGKSEEYMLAMQSLDNLRLSLYGIDNGGLFEKKAHELQSEADINGGPVGLVLQDGLSIRQNFCNIVNSIWGLGIWCEPSQTITKLDVDGDGKTYDSNEGESSPIEVKGESDNETSDTTTI